MHNGACSVRSRSALGHTAAVTLAGRWDELAEDLSAQAEALDAQERAGEVVERLRHEIAQLRLVDRLRAAIGTELVATCAGQVSAHGVLVRVASDALLIQEPAYRECLIASAHLHSVSGIPRLTAESGATRIAERIGLRVLLRAMGRDRSAVRLALLDGSVLDGTIDRVGSDFLELAAHAAAEARRRDAVREIIAVPLGALVAVRRDSV
jgi:hypothetical protein